MRGLFAVAFLVLSLEITSKAYGDELSDAKASYLEADFQRSRDLFETALRDATLTRMRAREAHRFLAALYFLFHEEGKAKQHALAAVALMPSVSPPPGAPPEVGKLFSEAQAQYLEPAALKITFSPKAKPTHALAQLTPAPEVLVARLELRCRQGGRVQKVSGAPPELRLALGASRTPPHCYAKALTASGVALFEVDRTFRPLTTPAPKDRLMLISTRPNEDTPPKKGATMWPWIAGAAGVVAAGAVAAILITRGGSGQENADFGEPTVHGW